MSNKHISMSKLKSIIQKLSKGASLRSISSQFKISRNTISLYKRKIEVLGIDYQEILSLSEDEICNLLQVTISQRLEDDERYLDLMKRLSSYKKELQSPGVTRLRLWQEYKFERDDGYQYSKFCHYLNKYLKSKDLTMVLQHQYGDVLELDFAGKKLEYVDFKTGEVIPVPVLVSVLSASVYPYIEALPNAKQEHVYAGLSRALRYFGGVPKRILSDNMKQYVEKPSRYEPTFNSVAEEWEAHYGTHLIAARVRKPKDKATVENSVYQTYINVFAALRHQVFYSLEELNIAIMEQVKLFVKKPFQKRKGCRLEDFTLNELPHLEPLPSTDYEYKHSVKSKVQKNYHICLGEDLHYYSVPYQHVGNGVKVVYDTKEVCIYYGYKQIAVHKRNYRQNGYSTFREHMPERHQRYQEQQGWDSNYFLSIMSKIGDNATQVTQMILSSRQYVQHSYKACCGLISLSKQYGHERFENACKRALTGPKVTYGIIENILLKNLDLQTTIPLEQEYIPIHENVRGKSFYA